jgi:ABC-type Zn uptake system ZnuABC Zn-binding protein ZnuA
VGAIVWCLGLFLAPYAPHASAKPMRVITSIFPLTDLVEQLAGDRLEVSTLIPAGASAHAYEPTPEQVRRLSEARVFFQVGLGLEFWLDKLVQAAKNPRLRQVDLSLSIVPLPVPPVMSVESDRPGDLSSLGRKTRQRSRGDPHREGEHAGGLDPHYWLDPVRMQAVLTTIEQVLRELDPDGAAHYTERAERVRSDLANLHHEILQYTQPLQNRRFIALHSAWTYFASRYNLQQAAVIEPFPGREPSARYLADLARLMRREGVNAVFMEPQLSRSAAQALAREVGAKVGVLDPTGGRGIPGRESYGALMRYNVAQLAEVLQ